MAQQLQEELDHLYQCLGTSADGNAIAGPSNTWRQKHTDLGDVPIQASLQMPKASQLHCVLTEEKAQDS